MPPNPRDKHRDTRRRAGRGLVLARVLVFGAVAIIVLPAVADVANGLLKPHEGCRVIGVVDGDTVRMYCPAAGVVRGRIIGYDTPEIFSPGCTFEWAKGIAATFHLRWQLWTASQISARPRGSDRYGRRLTFLTVDGEGVARPLVEKGLAHWYDGGIRRSWCVR